MKKKTHYTQFEIERYNSGGGVKIIEDIEVYEAPEVFHPRLAKLLKKGYKIENTHTKITTTYKIVKEEEDGKE